MNLTLIRAGAICKGHLKAISRVEQTDLVAIVDTDPWAKEIAAAVGASFYATTGTMLRSLEPDGVIVSTRTDHHLQPLINSLQTGARVLVEKLITPTMKEAKAFVDVSEKFSRHVLVGYHRRYSENILNLKWLEKKLISC